MFNLLFILLILIVILLLKLYLENSHDTINRYNTHGKNHGYKNHGYKNHGYNNIISNNDKQTIYNIENDSVYKKMFQDMKNTTTQKINSAIEQGYIEGFTAMSSSSSSGSGGGSSGSNGNNNKDTIVSYLNKGNVSKLMLFYKNKCPYCAEFLPIWYQIINNLPKSVMYEEIETDTDTKTATENHITSVPTLIIIVNNEKKTYMGDRSYNDIKRFLKLNGINLVERTFEEFDSSGYSLEPEPTKIKNSNCPTVTFDKQLDIEQDNYMFQIFNSDGQYGYAVGGNKGGKLLTPFTAAYSTVDSYLSSLPNTETKYVNECAKVYANEIRGFGLCDSENLDKVLEYDKDVKGKYANAVVDGTDYTNNKNIVSAIKKACLL